jgi:hypothetical protein
MRTIFHRIAWVLGVLAVASGYVFAMHGTHPAWMVTTFLFTLGTVITTAIAITSP